MGFKSVRVVNWPLWRPAASVMRGLRFPGKMLLISAAFLLPLLWLLGSFVLAERADTRFVALERQGVAFAKALYPVMDASDRWRLAARSAAFGDTQGGVASARAAFDQAFARLQQQQQVLGGSLGTEAAWQRVGQALEAVPDDAQSSPQRIYQTMTALSQSLAELLAEVTDRSGLALDPEMATYYLVSGTMMRAPEIMRRTGELRGLAGGALRSGRIETGQLDKLIETRAILQHTLENARSDMLKSRQVAGGDGQSLTMDTYDATQAFVTAVNRHFAAGQTEVQGDAAAVIGLANQALEIQHRQVLANLSVLDTLLATRERRLWSELAFALGLTVVGLLVALFLAMGFSRAMFGGFKSLRRHLMAISMGDLRTDIRGRGRDEVSDLLREVGYMQDSLRQTVTQVQGASDSVVQASLEISQGTQDLSTRTEAAAAALEQSSAALEETTSSVAHTADAARQASGIAQENAVVAERGGAAMGEVVQTMDRIQASSRKISDIISVIDGIAFQTNILALNAAVEAARAGEQGRGFAVVAGEVRSLAQRSAGAAKEIKELISSSVDTVERGMGVVRHAGQTMDEIVRHAADIRGLLDSVAGGAREQSMGIGQIGQAVQDLDRNTQANAALVEQTAAAAGAQRIAAVRMAAQVDEFRLPVGSGVVRASAVEGVDVDTFIDAHRQWKVRLRDAIEGHDRVDAATLGRDDCCALGKWIYGDGQRLADRPTFSELIERHKHFHRVAGEVGSMVNQRRYRQAEDAIAPGSPFAEATSAVVLTLSTAKRLGF